MSTLRGLDDNYFKYCYNNVSISGFLIPKGMALL
jgi:hypothetical protein